MNGRTSGRWRWPAEEWLRWCVRRGGRTAAEIGAPFGLSKAAVILKGRRMGLRFPEHGGAPAGNVNGAKSWYRPGNRPARRRQG